MTPERAPRYVTARLDRQGLPHAERAPLRECQPMLAIARGLVAHPMPMLVGEPAEGLSSLLVESLTEIQQRFPGV